MEISTESRTIEVKVIEIAGVKFDLETVLHFLYEDAYQFEDTIGKDGNYTSEYMFFQTKDERRLEKVLLELNIIRKPEYFKQWNEDVLKKGGFYDYTRYWLGDGYPKFYREFSEAYNKI